MRSFRLGFHGENLQKSQKQREYNYQNIHLLRRIKYNIITADDMAKVFTISAASDREAGFSLIELLVVVSVISLLTAVTGICLKSVGGSARVSTAGNRVSSLIEAARENAIVKKRPTAVVLLVPNTDIANRVFTVLEYQPPTGMTGTGTWKQIFKWEVLPVGVVVDSARDESGMISTNFLPPNSPTVSPFSPVSYQGKNYSPNIAQGCAYFVFLEDGRILKDDAGNPPSPVKLRLVEGIMNGSGVIQRTAAGATANYYDIIVNDATGRTKVVRP